MKLALQGLMLTLLMAMTAQAYQPDQQVYGGGLFSEYYTVSDPESGISQNSLKMNQKVMPQDVAAIFWELVDEGYQGAVKLYSLISFDLQKNPYGDVQEPYNRQKHFGTWVTGVLPEKECRNMRAFILERDSQLAVTYSRNGCTVATGLWHDPYTDREYRAASDLQIDHVVPLKNAYLAGADKWSRQKRCLYTNFRGNNFHLLAVLGAENGKKGDRSPDSYMPPNRQYSCEYLANWLKIKAIWKLGITPPEKAAALRIAKENHCPPRELSFSSADLARQRRLIDSGMNQCR